MPHLRSVDAISRSTPLATAQNVPMPSPSQDAEKIRVAVFDGGLLEDSILKPFATSHETDGIGKAVPELTAHGFDVTSAALFGSLVPGAPATKPAFHVDHYRVLDEDSKNDPFELYDVLGRIQSVLEQKKPKFVNLSLGPALPADNHEIHAWTAVLDEYVASTGALVTVAGGNTGTKPWPESRIQVPGDSVNMLCVGAADTRRGNWSSAPYSSYGPGRRPGVVKPDLLGFGGTATEPFIVYDQGQVDQVAATAGTSFAAPSLLRSAATIHSKFGSYVTPLATKALLINSSEPGADKSRDGWGRAEANISSITECGDGMVRVLYQGILQPTKSVRARIPIPHAALAGMVNITATLCFLSPTDPEDPTSYTRAGVDVIFRPNVTKNPLGKKHANTDSFFRNGDYESESDLRKAASKWETVMHATKNKRGSGLVRPSFDIHYIPRSGGGNAIGAEPIKYAMVITVRSAKTPDLYEKIVREFQGLLAEVQPVSQVQVQVTN